MYFNLPEHLSLARRGTVRTAENINEEISIFEGILQRCLKSHDSVRVTDGVDEARHMLVRLSVELATLTRRPQEVKG